MAFKNECVLLHSAVAKFNVTDTYIQLKWKEEETNKTGGVKIFKNLNGIDIASLAGDKCVIFQNYIKT